MNARWHLTLLAVLATLSCSVSPEPSAPEGEVDVAGPAASAEGPIGVVEGQVLFAGTEIPQGTKVENTTDPDNCGKVHSLENIIVSRDSLGIQNAIVTFADVALPDGYKPPASRLVLDNRQCRFEPHVAVLTVGSTIEAVSSDPFYHSVHLYGLKQLNVSLHTSKSRLIELPKRPGFLIVKCDVHGWMQAYIRVDPHPFHAVTDADGRFRIEGVPKGTHVLEVWHEHFGFQKHTVMVEPNTTFQSTITFTAQQETERQ